MTQYPGGVTKSELEIRLRRLRDEVNRLLRQEVGSAESRVAVRIAGAALDSVTWDVVTGKPTQFPPEPHTHIEAEITDLDKYTQAEVDDAIASAVATEDVNGGTAVSFYLGLEADGGNASETAFVSGIVDPGGA